MDERLQQFKVGVVVVAMILVAVILAVWFGELPTVIRGRYEIYIVFSEAPGVAKDTPIRKSGVLIGRVTDVTLNSDRTVTITARIDGDQSLYRDEVCVISPDLLGDATIEVVRGQNEDFHPSAVIQRVHAATPSDPPKRPAADASGKVEPGETMRGRTRSSPATAVADLQETLERVAGSVSAASESFKRASDKLGSAADNINQMLGQNREGVHEIIKRTGETMDLIGQVAKNVNTMIGDEQTQAEFRRSIQQVPGTLDRIRGAVDLVDVNLQHLEKFTRPLGEGAAERVARIDQAIVRLDALMADLSGFSQSLSNPTGTLGRLLKDPELYCHITNAARNVEELTERLKPIIEDARVFTDKIARHPETLGVRGALQRNPGIK